MKRLNDKLDYKKLGLFRINKVVGLVNFRLSLLKIINIYLVFYISLLELVLPRALAALNMNINLVNLDAIYKVEELLNY